MRRIATMSKFPALAVALSLWAVMSANQSFAQEKDSGDGGVAGVGIPELSTWRVASGLTLPLYLTAPNGDFNRAFIVEQRSGTTGRIRLLDLTTHPPTLQAAVYLSVTGVATGNEQGLLGLAFHPDFLNNGYFWVNYTNTAGTTVIARYRANAPYATSTSAAPTGTTILTVSQPFTNHNGGWIGFGPDGYLYIGMGDGGSANDPNGAGQNLNVMLGKILRLDVDGADNIPGNDDDDGDDDEPDSTNGYTSPATNPFFGATPGLDQIWAYGVRNPWRNSFDRLTGDFYIGDVGQNAWEEISFQPAASVGGENYGWRCMEGNHCTGLSGCTCELGCAGGPLTCPIAEYSHGSGCSITGGYVYRGTAIPELDGMYFYADYCSNTIWSMKYLGAPVVPTTRNLELAPGDSLTVNSITSFGEDASGEVYIVDQGGEIYKIVKEPANNACVNATPVGEGSFPFTTIGAVSDNTGWTECGGAIARDVWFLYTATCTGTARVSLCGSNFNSKVAVYNSACPTGAGQSIACNDDFCGTSAEVTFAAVAGNSYRIRVGGNTNTQTGAGTLVITCPQPPACPADITNNGIVDVDDLLMVINNWGSAGGPGDVNGNNMVDTDDLLEVINAWGPCT
jgi:glucose/arabinose dehydrogenase